MATKLVMACESFYETYQSLPGKDGHLTRPFTGKIISPRRVLVWSNGPDGQSGTPETDKDNVTSWNLE